MRPEIPAQELSEEQRSNLRGLDGVGAEINAILRARGLDLRVYQMRLGPLDAGEQPSTSEWIGEIGFSEPIEPEPPTLPPPGGCYCTDCDDQGRCWSYCC